MKVCLMARETDPDGLAHPPEHAADLVVDLRLDTVLDAMSGGDPFLRDVAHDAVLASLVDRETIAYRQDILRDALAMPELVRALYDTAVAALGAERSVYLSSFATPVSVLRRSVAVMRLLTEQLHRVRQLSEESVDRVCSAGLTRLLRMLIDQLDAGFFAQAEEHLKRLQMPGGVLMSARFGPGLKGQEHVLRRPLVERSGWRTLLPGGPSRGLSFTIPDQDEAGARALGELRDRGVNEVANALAQSVEHVVGFFRSLRAELGFAIGCMNLVDRLSELQLPYCFPELLDDPAAWSCRGLYDPCLALETARPVTGSSVEADGRRLVMVTGANQGGKSTFLRSVGVAALMMHSGLPVAAHRLAAGVATGVFTHFPREEDRSMTRGKLDEELDRMSRIVSRITPGGLLLGNESLASTNEREGSQIAEAIVRALVDSGVRVFFVTHLYELSHGLAARGREDTLFLRAEHLSDGTRTFRMVEGTPLPTSHGTEVYGRVFGIGTLGCQLPAP